jgi:hypothetical protein
MRAAVVALKLVEVRRTRWDKTAATQVERFASFRLENRVKILVG